MVISQKSGPPAKLHKCGEKLFENYHLKYTRKAPAAIISIIIPCFILDSQSCYNDCTYFGKCFHGRYLMRKNYISLFDVIGPVMVGPSSSHTSGAATIAWMARQIFSGVPSKVTFTLYGSFADTYLGHGTDRALIGGSLGYRSDDTRIRNAYENARAAGMEVVLIPDPETEVRHPNTVDIVMESADGHSLLIRGESIGGGRVRIVRINNINVEFTGEYSTLIVGHLDEAGTIAFITSRLANYQVNIAFMKLFREDKGKKAFTVIESDEFIPEEIKDELLKYPSIKSVDVIEF